MKETKRTQKMQRKNLIKLKIFRWNKEKKYHFRWMELLKNSIIVEIYNNRGKLQLFYVTCKQRYCKEGAYLYFWIAYGLFIWMKLVYQTLPSECHQDKLKIHRNKQTIIITITLMDGDLGMLLEEQLKNNKNRLISLVIFLISLILDLHKHLKIRSRRKLNSPFQVSNNNNLNRTWMNGHLEIITLIAIIIPLLTNQFNCSSQLKLMEHQLTYLICEFYLVNFIRISLSICFSLCECKLNKFILINLVLIY